MNAKSEITATVLALYNGNKSIQEIQDELHLLYPDDANDNRH